ncbi:PIN domain-containing protein [Streptomyces sp. NPDC093707]|uniref:PIN domain-containing protein n=1 Tax=Streptomyces sp. NPDC093707 TaxID=3154984 RepID=UPI00344B1022
MTAAPPLAVVDTCVWLAAFNRRDDHHGAAVRALATPRILVVSPLVLGQLDHTRRSATWPAGEQVGSNPLTPRRVTASAG